MSEQLEVYKAITAVQADLCREGITKDRKNQQQGYNFRGIDDVYNALSPLLARHALCILPRILSRHCDERATKSGGTMSYVTVDAEFDFVSAKDGSKHTVKTFGEAMDSADKATNKAMSAAYKYAAFQAFAIPTEGDNDADAHTPEPVSRKSAPAKPPANPDKYSGALDAIQKCKTLKGLETITKTVTNYVGTGLLTAEQGMSLNEKIDAKEAELKSLEPAPI